MKLQLHTDIEITIDNDVVLKIQARRLTKKEGKAFSKDIDKLIASGKDYDKLTRRVDYLEKKYELTPNIEILDELYNLEEEKADFDGLDINDQIEKLYLKKFDTIVSGDDTAKLKAIAEDIGFRAMDEKLSKAIEEANKQGE